MAGRFESLLLYVNLAAHGLLLLGAVWSITVPKRRIYPMARRGPAFRAMWILFSYVFVSNAALVMLGWNSGWVMRPTGRPYLSTVIGWKT